MRAFEQNIKEEAEHIRLSEDQKRELRERLLSYIAYHPLPESLAAVALPAENAPKSFLHILSAEWQIRSLAGVAIFLMVVGIPAVAERSMPGDVLYPVKVRVNEEVLSTLSFGPYEKMEWEARRIERRVAEARLLAHEGKLTEEVQAQITETVKEHTANAEKELALLRESDSEEADVAQVVLESALDVQSAMLETNTASTSSDVQKLATAVASAKATIAAGGGESEVSESSYVRFLKRTEESIAYSHKSLSAIETSLTPEDRSEIEHRLADISHRVERAAELAGRDKTREAIRMLRDALRDSQKLSAFITDIEVRNTVTLESLVPQASTAEERRLALLSLRDELESRAAAVQVRTTFATDPEVIADITKELSTVATYILEIEENLEKDAALEEGEEVAVKAEVLMETLEARTRNLVPATPETKVDQNTATSTGEVVDR